MVESPWDPPSSNDTVQQTGLFTSRAAPSVTVIVPATAHIRPDRIFAVRAGAAGQ